MRLLFVWSSAEFSTWDVARGYRRALERQGRHDIRDYRLYARMKYHVTALGDKRAEDLNLVTRIASENIVVEAMKHRADLVFIVSGMALHPDALWLLRRAGIRAAVLFTESPYNDTEQREFHAVYPEMTCFTMERTSAGDGWAYLPHAYDADIHRPSPMPMRDDVLLIGTLWQDRIRLLERVDWSGVRLRLFGTWVTPPLPSESPIGQFYEEGCIPNHLAPTYYGGAKICLNPHRAHPTAESLNPRAYELAACAAFQLTDCRAEARDVFNGSVATFADAADLEQQVRYWLARERDREDAARAAAEAVVPHTFDARADTLMRALE